MFFKVLPKRNSISVFVVQVNLWFSAWVSNKWIMIRAWIDVSRLHHFMPHRLRLLWFRCCLILFRLDE